MLCCTQQSSPSHRALLTATPTAAHPRSETPAEEQVNEDAPAVEAPAAEGAEAPAEVVEKEPEEVVRSRAGSTCLCAHAPVLPAAGLQAEAAVISLVAALLALALRRSAGCGPSSQRQASQPHWVYACVCVRVCVRACHWAHAQVCGSFTSACTPLPGLLSLAHPTSWCIPQPASRPSCEAHTTCTLHPRPLAPTSHLPAELTRVPAPCSPCSRPAANDSGGV